MTETCDADYPHLIVHVETTTATVPDHALVETIHTELAEKHTLPGEHLVDTGYVDALNIVTSQHNHHIDLIGPAMPDMQWQATQQTGYDLSQFVLDWEQQRAICPQGKTSLYWHEGTTPYNDPVINIRFSGKDCHPCAVRHLCTRSKVHGRALHVRPQTEHEALQRRRKQQQTEAFIEKYKKRAGIEGTISQSVRTCEMRQSRYIGIAKTHLQHLITAAALNLMRVVEWFSDPTLAQTRISRFAHLAP